VIVGAGFGGLEAAYRLEGAAVSLTLVDRRNHHRFQPLLYQVATASLATSTWPNRYLLRGRPEVTTLFATALVVFGFGQGLSMTPLLNLVLGFVQERHAGSAAAQCCTDCKSEGLADCESALPGSLLGLPIDNRLCR
jgi:hypothetical protein